MKEIGLKCNLCNEFFSNSQLVENKIIGNMRPEKIIGISYDLDGKMRLNYKNPIINYIHICRNCLWMLREETE